MFTIILVATAAFILGACVNHQIDVKKIDRFKKDRMSELTDEFNKTFDAGWNAGLEQERSDALRNQTLNKVKHTK